MQPVQFSDFILGGLADSDFFGPKNSMAEIVGFDMHSQPGKLLVNQKLTKDSDDVVTEFCKVGIPVSDGSTLWFSSESGRIWREVSGTYTLVHTLALPAQLPWEIQHIEFSGNEKAAQGNDAVVATHMNAAGTILLTMTGRYIRRYNLATPFNLASATYNSQFDTATQTDEVATGMWVNPEGTYIFVTSPVSGGRVFRYDLSSAYSVTSASYSSVSFAHNKGPCSIAMKAGTGAKMFLSRFAGGEDGEVYEYDLDSLIEINTAVLSETVNAKTIITTYGHSVNGLISMALKGDGTKIFFGFTGNDDHIGIYEMEMTTPFDITTLTYSGNRFRMRGNAFTTTYDIGIANDVVQALSIGNDGKFFIVAHQAVGGVAPKAATMYQFNSVLEDEDLNVTVLGALEHDEKIYIAPKNRLLAVPVSGIDTFGDLIEVGRFDIGDPDYHPMKRLNGILYIGDADQIAQVEDNDFVPDALKIVKPLRVSTLGAYDVDLLVGTIISENIKECQMIRWNTWSNTWQYADPIPEAGINAFLDTDNEVVVSAGTKGHIYTYNGVQLISKKQLPGTFTRGTNDKCRVYHNGVFNFENVALFGVSQVEGNSIKYGIYSYANRSSGYPKVFAIEYVISEDTMEDVEIGAIVSSVEGFTVSWRQGDKVGIDRLDIENKYSGAYVVTRNIVPDRLDETEMGQVDVAFASLPEDTTIQVWKKLNYADTFTECAVKKDLKRGVFSTKEKVGSFYSGQLKIVAIANDNDAPEIELFTLSP